MARFADFLYRHRRVLFGLWLVHALLLHVFVLGYMTGDGLSYRVTPVIELVQHGELGKWKYPTDWSLRGYVPFVELAHAPFLLVLGLRGLLVGFPLVVFPLCAAAVLRFVHELTGDRRAALFGAFAYVAMPMINAQAFAGLVDFVVAGILAFWLYALLRLRSDEPPRRTGVRIVIATVLLSMSRQQGLYIAIALLPFVMFAMFGQRDRWRIRWTNSTAVARACIAVAIGAIPAVALQAYRAVVYGSPIAPSELKILGIELAPGAPLRQYLRDAGLDGDDPISLLDGFFNGWVWHVEWPMGAFYHSQWLAAGFITIFALVMLPKFVRSSTRTERWLVVGLVLVSIMARDFALPRWAYPITISITIIIGRTMSALVDSPRLRPLFWAGCVVLFVGLLRPEVDLAQIKGGHWIAPRVNVAASPWFLRGPGEIHTYPDRHYKLALIEHTYTGYTTYLFGRRLTNEVVGTVRAHELGERCAGLRPLIERIPEVLFVDDLDQTRDCARTCILGTEQRCKLFQIRP